MTPSPPDDCTAPPSLTDPEHLAARERLADAMRAFNHTFVSHLSATDDIDAAAYHIDRLRSLLEQGPLRAPDLSATVNRYLEPLPQAGDQLPTSPHRAIAGRANPYGIPFDTWYHPPWVVTELVLGPAHEGANSLAHGGIIAGIFDDLTGRVQSTIGVMAVTGQLTINYLAGVPLDVPLLFRARLAGREGRKLVIEAEARHDDQTLATAQALWIQIPSERFGLPPGLRAS